MPLTNEFDVAIIGGGMVGASLANMLSTSQPQWRIALIESQPFLQADAAYPQSGFDSRSTAVSFGTANLLRELGVWEKLQPHATAITQVHVSDRGHFLGGTIDAAAGGLDAVGYVIENSWLSSVLLAQVLVQDSITCFSAATVQQLIPQENSARLRIQRNGEEFFIDSALVVVADGSNSAVRRDLGISTRTEDYHQTAIITNVEFTEPHRGAAYERFTDEGPIALLPLGETATGQRSALIWTLPTANAADMMAANDEEFLAQLQIRFGFRVGRFTRVAKRVAYPLQLVVAEEQIRSHVVLLGNAAHFLHPVAGQGFNLALRDCACLVETLRNSASDFASGKSLGNLSVLQGYIDKQMLDQYLTIHFSDKLVRLFSSDHLPLIALRHLGLSSLESLPFLKDLFVAQTMGTGGRKFQWRLDALKPFVSTKSAAVVSAEKCAIFSQTLASTDTQFDVVIVGAGVVGAALACAIAHTESAQKLRIAVIEAGGDMQRYSGDQFDPRVVALTHASENLLHQLGCWDGIVRERVCAYRQMKVWDGEGTASIEFDCADVQQDYLGHIVENSVVVSQLRARMTQLKNITYIQPATVTEISSAEKSRQRVCVRLSNECELTASLLIAADGAHSQVRDLARFATREWDYGQDAIICTVRTEKPHEFTAWQRFMRSGPLAFLPLQNGGDTHQCSIVWSADRELARVLMALNDEAFCTQLTQAFEARLGRVLSCDQRFSIALRQRHATHYIQPGIALVGDAAHSIHPLAGQGVNLGLSDVRALANEIDRALLRGIPLSDESILRRYQRQRLADNLGMMSAMDAFKRLFGNQTLGVNWLRNTGMRQLNSLPLVKRFIVNTAMGLGAVGIGKSNGVI